MQASQSKDFLQKCIDNSKDEDEVILAQLYLAIWKYQNSEFEGAVQDLKILLYRGVCDSAKLLGAFYHNQQQFQEAKTYYSIADNVFKDQEAIKMIDNINRITT